MRTRSLPIIGEYPPNWKAISDATWAAAGHRCIRCAHPYRKGENGKGEWSPCDERCLHGGPIKIGVDEGYMREDVKALVQRGYAVCAQWRVGTVHHLDGNKANCVWWNLLALCQRCHLTIQSRVNPETPYFLSHSDWFKPYVAGFYAKKYEGKDITREEAIARMPELLAYELVA